jgi:hypothetical protein
MPIKNLTQSLAEAGKIKIGGLGEERTSKGGKTYRQPEKYSRFVITTNERDASGQLIPDDRIMDALDKDQDGQLTEIPIYLHSDDADSVFPHCYACYTGKRLHCTGDGETATRYEIKEGKRTGANKQVACPCSYLDEGSKIRCKPHGTLQCSIAVPGEAVAGAVYRWRTTSIISIRRMLGSLEQIRGLCGGFRGLPLTLKLLPVLVRDQTITVYCCHIELRARNMGAVRSMITDAAMMRDRTPAAALPAPDLVIDERETAEEFYPENNTPIDEPMPNMGNDALAGKL